MAAKKSNKRYLPYKTSKSSLRKRTSSQFKAAANTRDAMRLNVKCNVCLSSAYDKTNDYGVTAVNVYEVLKQNPQFTSFSKLYDQVKVNGVRVKLNVVDATLTAASAASVKTISVVTAWDRTGLSKEQVNFYDASKTAIVRSDWDMSGASYFAPKVGKGIVNATGVSKTLLNSFQKWTSQPFLYPSTMEEKGQYLSTSNFEDSISSYDYSTNYYTVSSDIDNTPITELFNNANPCLPFESPSCVWKPTLLIGVFKSSYDSTNKVIIPYDDCDPVLFNAEFSIDVTFRNLKASV